MDENPLPPQPQPQQRRQHYRVAYPPGLRPELRIAGRTFPVLDLSESGIRFENREVVRLPGDLLQGTITFHDGGTEKVLGRVFREQDNYTVILLIVKRIPYSRILAEQKLLRQASPR
jgi:hypothetical protein